jgi:hypothetical protein
VILFGIVHYDILFAVTTGVRDDYVDTLLLPDVRKQIKKDIGFEAN